MLLLLALQVLTLGQVPQKIVTTDYCLSSLLGEPKTGCMSWNPRETAGPVLDPTRGVLYIGGSDGMLHLVSPQNTHVQKRIPLPGKLLNKPTLSGNNLIVATSQGHVLNFGPDSLTVKWDQKLDSEISNQVLISGNQAYVVTGLSTLYALDIDSGEILWEKRRPQSTMTLSQASGPLLIGNKLALGNSSGKLEFIQSDNGNTAFEVSLGDNKKPFPDIATDPIFVADGQIAVASYNQGLAVLSASTGVVQWSLPNLPNITHLASAKNLIITAGPKQVSAIDIETHKMLWKFSYLTGSPNQLIVNDGKILFASDQGALYVLDAQTGKQIQMLGSGTGFASDFHLSPDGTLFALSNAGYLHKYQYGRKRTQSSCGSH